MCVCILWKAMEDVLSELDQVQTVELDENEQALEKAKASFDEKMDLLDVKVRFQAFFKKTNKFL